MRPDGKVAVVLGASATDDMGQVIDSPFAQQDAKVIVGGRNVERQNLQVNGGLTLRRNPSGPELVAVMPPEAMAHLAA